MLSFTVNQEENTMKSHLTALVLCMGITLPSIAGINCQQVDLAAHKQRLVVENKEDVGFYFRKLEWNDRTFWSFAIRLRDSAKSKKIEIPLTAVYELTVLGTNDRAKDFKDSFSHAAVFEESGRCILDFFNLEKQEENTVVLLEQFSNGAIACGKDGDGAQDSGCVLKPIE
jgi:hypothetical protein